MIIDMPLRIDLSCATVEDAKDTAWQHYRDTLSAINAAELATINNRPQPVSVSPDAADRLCRTCNGKGWVLDDDDVFTNCPGCASTGADTAILHAAE